MDDCDTAGRIDDGRTRPDRGSIHGDRETGSSLQFLKPGTGIRSRLVKVLLIAVGVTAWGPGCVRRTVTITTEPSNALVLLNDQEVGRSAVSTDFLWYGDYDVVIRKEGYKTLATNWKIDPPWYQYIPLDFFAEVLWPGWIHDQRSRHFALEPAETPTADELLERASEVRERALDPRRE